VKDQLEGLVIQMVDRGILFDEAVGEFEKRFIKRVLDRTNGNQSRAALVLGIHRNTLSRKIGEYKLASGNHVLAPVGFSQTRRLVPQKKNGSLATPESRS